MNKLFKTLTAVILFLSLPSAAKETCQPDPEMRAVYDSFDFYIVGNKFQNPPYTDLCNPNVSPTKTYQALAYLKKLKSLPRLQGSLDLNISGEDPYAYFKSQIDEITFKPEGDPDCDQTRSKSGQVIKTAAFVIYGSRATTICEHFATMDLGEAASALVHEARHVIGYTHVDCSQGIFNGAQGACDSSYDYKGSYALSAEFALRLSKHPSLDPILKETSRLNGIDFLVTRFNRNPLKVQKSLLLLDEGRVLWKWKEGIKTEIPIRLENSALLSVRDQDAAVFEFENKKAQSLLFKGVASLIGDFAKRVREADFNVEIKNVRDVVYGSNFVCLLASGKVACSKNGMTMRAFDLGSIEADALIFDDLKVFGSQNSFYLVSKEGLLYPISDDWAKIQKLDLSRVKPLNVKSNFRRILNIGSESEAYVLDREGRVLKGEKSKGRWKFNEVPSLSGMRFQGLSIYRESSLKWEEI